MFYPDLAPDPTFIRNEKRNMHNFKLEFVDSGLYYVKDENNSISVVPDPNSANQKSTDPTGFLKQIIMCIYSKSKLCTVKESVSADSYSCFLSFSLWGRRFRSPRYTF